MSKIAKKVKDKMMSTKDKTKDKMMDTKDKTKDKVTSTKQNVSSSSSSTSTSPSSSQQEREFEEGAAGTQTDRKRDPLKEYDEKEAMTPAKIKEHEPTAVRRDPSDQKIVEPGQEGANPEEAKEIARKSGMAKGTAGAEETGSEYEQGAAGSNK